MASPGEWFPQSFATAIISAAESRRRADAQLAEMRNQRAAENFLQEQRLRLGQQQLQSSEAQNEVQAQIALERAKLDAERVKKEREAAVARSIAEFGKTGFAFIPTYAADKIPALMGLGGGEGGAGGTGGDTVFETKPTGSTSETGEAITTGKTGAGKTLRSARAPGSPTVTTVELPGFGTILQRVGGPGFEKQEADLKKVQALTEKYRQDGILAQKRGEAAQLAAYERASRISNMKGKLSLESLRLANNVRESLRKQGEEALTTLRFSQKPEDKERANKAAHDLSYIFADDSEERRNWDIVNDIIESGLTAQREGVPLPEKTDVKTMEALGVDKILFGGLPAPSSTPTAAEQVRINGRVQIEGKSYFVTEDRRLIPTDDTKTPLGFLPPVAPGSGRSFQPGPEAAAAPSPLAPTGKPSATPEQVQAARDLRKRLEAAPPGSPERRKLAQELKTLSDTVDLSGK